MSKDVALWFGLGGFSLALCAKDSGIAPGSGLGARTLPAATNAISAQGFAIMLRYGPGNQTRSC
ncbi:MAG: hypothetical protein C0409_01040 [Novosphingobium sp.]|nr:hypothetical protein [Novosphingobium sp.]